MCLRGVGCFGVFVKVGCRCVWVCVWQGGCQCVCVCAWVWQCVCAWVCVPTARVGEETLPNN